MHFRVVFCGLQWQGECCGLDMKGTPKGPRVWIWSPAVVPPRKVVDPSGGGVSLEEVSPRWVSCFIDQSHVLFTFCFLIANVTWPASCFSPWPQFCSSRHAFSYCCRAEWAVLPELEAKETSPPSLALVRCFDTTKENEPRQTVRCVDMVQGGDLIWSAVVREMKSIG